MGIVRYGLKLLFGAGKRFGMCVTQNVADFVVGFVVQRFADIHYWQHATFDVGIANECHCI